MTAKSVNHLDPDPTAAAQPTGGCFSLIFSPFYFVLLVLAILLMASGETTQPWELTGHSADDLGGNGRKGTSGISPLFTPEVLYWEDNILRWAAEWELDPNLVATVMQIESCGDPFALSPSGAIGLFQVMPYHFQGDEAPNSPETNAMRGLAYLKQANLTYQSVRLSLAAYNGGIGTAANPESVWPDETIGYVYWGTNIYRDAAAGQTASPTLDEWLSKGGVNLCSQARARLGLKP
jgi:hypothetical protein